jgi:hypothetical protein
MTIQSKLSSCSTSSQSPITPFMQAMYEAISYARRNTRRKKLTSAQKAFEMTDVKACLPPTRIETQADDRAAHGVMGYLMPSMAALVSDLTAQVRLINVNDYNLTNESLHKLVTGATTIVDKINSMANGEKATCVARDRILEQSSLHSVSQITTPILMTVAIWNLFRKEMASKITGFILLLCSIGQAAAFRVDILVTAFNLLFRNSWSGILDSYTYNERTQTYQPSAHRGISNSERFEDVSAHLLTPQQGRKGVPSTSTPIEVQGSSIGVGGGVMAVIAIIGLVVMQKMPSGEHLAKTFNKFGSNLKTFDNMERGLSGLMRLTDKLENTILPMFYDFCGYENPEYAQIRKYAEHGERMADWVARVSTIDTEETRVRLTYDDRLRKEIFEMRDEGDKIVALLGHNLYTTQQVILMFRRAYDRIVTISALAVKTKDYGSRKIDPFTICFYGQPGVGKSVVMKKMEDFYSKIADLPEYNRTYFRGCEKYWSGYHGQPITIYDDFGQFRGANVEGDHFSEFINIGSPGTFILPKADLAEKGDVFKSHLVMLATNDPYPRPSTITNHDALYRRRNLLVEITSSIPPEYYEKSIVPGNIDHLTFRLRNPLGPNLPPPASASFNFEQLCSYLQRSLMSYHKMRAPQFYETLLAIAEQQANAEAEIEDVPFFVEEDHPLLELPRKVSSSLWTPSDITGSDYSCSGSTSFDEVDLNEPTVIINQGIEIETGTEGYRQKPNTATNPDTDGYRCKNGEFIAFKDLKFMSADHRRKCIDVGHLIPDLNYYSWKNAPKAHVEQGPKCCVTQGKNQFDIELEKMIIYYESLVDVELKAGIMDELNERFTTKEVSACLQSVRDRQKAREHNTAQTKTMKEKFMFFFKKEVSTPFQQFCHDHPIISKLALIYAGMVAVGMGLRIYCHFTGQDPYEFAGGKRTREEEEKDAIESVIGTEGLNAYEGLNKAQPTRSVRVRMTPIKTEGEDPNAMEIVERRIVPNMITVSRPSSGSRKSALKLQGFHFADKLCLIPFHLIDGILNECIMEVTMRSTSFKIRFDWKDVVRIPDKDLAIWNMGNAVPSAPNSMKQFMTRKDMETLRPTEGELVTTGLTEFDIKIRSVVDIEPLDVYHPQGVQYGSDNMDFEDPQKVHLLRSGFVYKLQTRPGTCGAILTIANPRFPAKIIGMHIGSDKVFGISQPLIFEEIAAHATKLKSVLMDGSLGGSADIITVNGKISNDQDAIDRLKIIPKGNFTYYGAYYKTTYVGDKTKLRPTQIHDLVEPHQTEPAVLNDFDPRLDAPMSVLQTSVEKYGHTVKPFPREHVINARNDLITVFENARGNTVLHPCGLIVAINGDPKREYMDRLNMKTSPGVPWSDMSKKGKEDLFIEYKDNNDPENPKFYPIEELRKAVENRVNQAYMGQRVDSIWMDCLKDEKRSLDRVAAGKTRSFIIAPVDYTIVSRMFTLEFCALFYSARLNIPSAVGIDPRSTEWTRLYNKLLAKGPNILEFDFKNWDGKVDPNILGEAMSIIDAMYTSNELDKIVRQVLLDELIHTITVAKNLVYQSHIGMPSGCSLTVVLNTLVHMLYIRIAWRALAHQYGHPELAWAFDKYVTYFAYGDDGIGSVHDDVKDWFNQITICKFLQDHDHDCTQSDKSDVTEAFTPVANMTFLKSHFAAHPQYDFLKLAPIKTTTIYEELNWMRECDDPKEQLYSNIEDAFVFAYHHGESFFNNLLERVNDALRQIGFDRVNYNYSDFDNLFLSNAQMDIISTEGFSKYTILDVPSDKSLKDHARAPMGHNSDWMPLSHAHELMPMDGKRYYHQHHCEICNEIFEHQHANHGNSSQNYNKHVCNNCPGGTVGSKNINGRRILLYKGYS